MILSGDTHILLYTLDDFKLVKTIDVEKEVHKMIVLSNGSIVVGMTKFTIQIISTESNYHITFKIMEDSLILDIIEGE